MTPDQLRTLAGYQGPAQREHCGTCAHLAVCADLEPDGKPGLRVTGITCGLAGFKVDPLGWCPSYRGSVRPERRG